MATATEPSPSPSPQLSRDTRHLPSPWSHVVRGEPEAAAPPSPSSAVIPPMEPADRPSPTATADDQAAGSPPGAAGVPDLPSPSDGGGGDGTAGSSRGKKPAWNRPSNGVVEAGAVMGAVSWPALSEAAKAYPRSPASDSGKGLSDGSASAALAPAIAITSSPPRHITKNTNFSSSARHASPTRQKSAKHCGSSSGSAITNSSSGALANGSAVPPASAVVIEESLDTPVTLQPSSRDSNNRSSSNWDHGSRGGGGSLDTHGGNDQQRNYGSNRRGNNGGGGGGGGGAPYHNNFANRRSMERGGYDWNRSFSGGRDLQGQHQHQHQHHPRAMARPFIRPLPPGSAPFISPPPSVRPFVSPMGYYDATSPFFYVPPHPSPESHGGMPFVGPPAIFYAAPDAQLRATLAKQIDYYFSPENLCKDIYLRQNMDEEGWVSISLIASFNRVRKLTNNVQFIFDTVRASTVVEVQGDKIRRRNDWMNWPPLAPSPNPPHSSTVPNSETLATHVRNVKLDEQGTSQKSTSAINTEITLGRSWSELNSQSHVVIASNGKGSGQTTALASSSQSVLARSLGRSDTF